MFSDVWHTRLLEWFSELHGNNWGNFACKPEQYEIFCELEFPLPSTPSNSELPQWRRQRKQGLKSKMQVHIIFDKQELLLFEVIQDIKMFMKICIKLAWAD